MGPASNFRGSLNRPSPDKEWKVPVSASREELPRQPGLWGRLEI